MRLKPYSCEYNALLKFQPTDLAESILCHAWNETADYISLALNISVDNPHLFHSKENSFWMLLSKNTHRQ